MHFKMLCPLVLVSTSFPNVTLTLPAPLIPGVDGLLIFTVGYAWGCLHLLTQFYTSSLVCSTMSYPYLLSILPFMHVTYYFVLFVTPKPSSVQVCISLNKLFIAVGFPVSALPHLSMCSPMLCPVFPLLRAAAVKPGL